MANRFITLVFFVKVYLLLLTPYGIYCNAFSCSLHRTSAIPDYSGQIITARPDSETATLQRLPHFVGISGATTEAKGISMDLVVIPAGVPHQPHNLSNTEAAHAIGSRDDPNEQENVVLYNPNIE